MYIMASHVCLSPTPSGERTASAALPADTVTPNTASDTARSLKRTARMPATAVDTAKADTAKADTVKVDTLKRKAGIDSPVEYTAEDSMIYDAHSGLAFLYGRAQVNYLNMQLTAAKIAMNMDSSLVHAEARPD